MFDVHLLDGTYDLFRHFFGAPKRSDELGEECGAVVGVLGSVLGMFEAGNTHIGVATDHVIESYRNAMWPGYKTGAGIDPTLEAQFWPLEAGLEAMGVTVWAMVEEEADDALASAAALAAADDRVGRVFICTPDKDLGQCVVGDRIVQLDRRQRITRDAAGVAEKFGVPPASIPDYLALVGDSADGFPGLSGWGAKSAGLVLAKFGHLEDIPERASEWGVSVRGPALNAVLRGEWELALLFRNLATLRADLPLFADIEALRWRGPTPAFADVCARLKAPDLLKRARALAERLEVDPAS